MNDLNMAVEDYIYKVERAIACANQMIAGHASNRIKLIELNQAVASISAISKEIASDEEHYFVLQSALSSLNVSLLDLNTVANEAIQTLSGHLGRSFDELRVSSEDLSRFSNHELDAFKPLLKKYQMTVDSVCIRLINDCVTDSSLLRILRSSKSI